MSYVAMAWPRGRPAPLWASRLQAAAPGGWDAAYVEPGLCILSSARGPGVAKLKDGAVIGEVTPNAGAGSETLLSARAAGELFECAWGAYVALSCDDRLGWRVWRDPSGALDAIAWSLPGGTIVASDLHDWLDPWLAVDVGVDWEQVACFVARPIDQSGRIALRGMHALAPGETWSQTCGGEQVWTPAQAACRPSLKAEEALGRLPALLDEVVATQAAGRVLIELSGGLDSSILASALSRSRASAVFALNYYVGEAGGDERAFARAVAERHGFTLIETEKAPQRLELATLAARPAFARPALNALDLDHDEDVACRCRDLAIDTIMTGQGGDHVFFQAGTPLIASDALPWLSPRMLGDLGRRLGRSSWSVLGEALRARLGTQPEPRPAHVTAVACDIARRRSGHPWLLGTEALPPAKRLQARSLINALNLNGPSRRGEAARLRHPLLSQPMMEFCLALPVRDLTRGGRDRGLARDAFASRLPAAIVRRRGKGRLSGHYGRMLHAALDDLRDLLLEGRVAQEGLVDRRVLEAMLSLEQLIWRGGYGAVLNLAVLEIWIQSWEARLKGLHKL